MILHEFLLWINLCTSFSCELAWVTQVKTISKLFICAFFSRLHYWNLDFFCILAQLQSTVGNFFAKAIKSESKTESYPELSSGMK